jgi:hypothetical protein
MRRVFLFDRWLEIDRPGLAVRLVPLRLPSVLTGITMLAIPAALLLAVRTGRYELAPGGLAFTVGYSVLALVFLGMPFAPSNRALVLDLSARLIRRGRTETAFTDAALRFVAGDRRGAAYATLGGKEIRFLYLANDFVEMPRLVIHAAAAAIRGSPDDALAQLEEEARRHEWKAYVAHLMIPILMLGGGAFYYYWYCLRGEA